MVLLCSLLRRLISGTVSSFMERTPNTQLTPVMAFFTTVSRGHPVRSSGQISIFGLLTTVSQVFFSKSKDHYLLERQVLSIEPWKNYKNFYYP